MSISHLLEDFSKDVGAHSISLSDVSLEEQKIKAFEDGYKAGWQDAVKAANDDMDRISTDFAGNIQDISFTLAEAQRDLLEALRPLLTGMVDSILPHLARKTLGERVIETLDSMIRGATSGQIELITAPSNANCLRTLLDDHDFDDAIVTAEASLGDGQVHVRAGGTEQEIDVDAVLKQIDLAVTGFFEENLKDTA
jgi:flagellar assembly protein FliH